MPDGVMLSKEYERQIRDLIRRDRGSHRVLDELESKQSRKKPSRFPQKAVVLDEELPAPTDSKEPTSVKATVLRWSVADSEYVETSETIDVFNHGEGLTHESGAFGAVLSINGHYWFFALAAGGEGGGSCCCSCVCVDPNLAHPGGFLTARDWVIGLKNPTAWARATNDNGDVRVKAGDYSISWNDSTSRWEYSLTVTDVDWRNDNGAVLVPDTVTGMVYMEWVSASEPVLIRIDFDATGDPFMSFP